MPGESFSRWLVDKRGWSDTSACELKKANFSDGLRRFGLFPQNPPMAHAATGLPATYQKLQGQIISPNFREATAIVTLPMPVPAAKEILVRTHWAGVNASDLNLTNARVSFVFFSPCFRSRRAL